MATLSPIRVPGTDTWTLITADSGFLITNESSYPVKVCFSSGAPAAGINGHTLAKHTGLVRNDLTGDVYIKAGHLAEITVSN
jgi:hypothetical protein